MFTLGIIKRIYFVAVGLILVIYFYLYCIGEFSYSAYFFLSIVSVWYVSVAYLAIYRRKENAMFPLLYTCKLAEFIEKYSHEHAQDTMKGYSTEAAILLATAYMHIGDIETSLEIFQQVELRDPRKAKRKHLADVVTQNTLYHNNLSTAYLRQHDIENAELHINKAKVYLKQLQCLTDKKGKNKKAINNFIISIANRELELALELGSEIDYAEKIEQLKLCADGAETVLNRVYFHYLLSVLYEKNGDVEEAEKCREYVRKNGGDTCYVQWVET